MPVIVLLILFFIRALILIGGFFGRYLQVKKTTAVIYGKLNGLNPATLADFENNLPSEVRSVLIAYIHKIIEAGPDRSKADLLISEYEIEADKELSTAKTLTKMGPILGLMGTLIPMGPALVGLASGDIASMAYNMQVAFATTVVGLVVSAIGFVTQQTKERWAATNLTILEYLADVVGKEKGGRE